MVSPFQTSLFRFTSWLTGFCHQVIFKEIPLGAAVTTYFPIYEWLSFMLEWQFGWEKACWVTLLSEVCRQLSSTCCCSGWMGPCLRPANIVFSLVSDLFSAWMPSWVFNFALNYFTGIYSFWNIMHPFKLYIQVFIGRALFLIFFLLHLFCLLLEQKIAFMLDFFCLEHLPIFPSLFSISFDEISVRFDLYASDFAFKNHFHFFLWLLRFLSS